AVRQRLGVAVVADVAKTGLLQQLADAVAGVKAFGIELVGDHTHFVVHDNFAGDQAFPVLADRALAADEMVVVDPLPRALIEVFVHVPAIGDVEHQLAAGTQDLADRGQHLLVVLLVGEVAERVAHDGNAIHDVLREPWVARVTFLEDALQALALRPLFGEPHQVARAVKPHDVAKAASGKLQAVSALAAAQVENLAVWLDLGGRYDEVDLTARVLAILDHVTVGLHIEGVEELPPPLLREVCLEVRYGTQARTRCQSSRALGPCRHHHGGQLSSSLPPAAAAGARPYLPAGSVPRPVDTTPVGLDKTRSLVCRFSLSNFYLWTMKHSCKLQCRSTPDRHIHFL